MVDAVQGFGNGRLIPAGPLREPVGPGLARADLVVLVGEPDARDAALRRWPVLAKTRIIHARLCPVPAGLPLAGEAVVAFAGIARPEKFFETLRRLGARPIATHAFPDHHRYRKAILKRLVAEARSTRSCKACWLRADQGNGPAMPSARTVSLLALALTASVADTAPAEQFAPGEKLALRHCGRCHVVNERNRMGGIGSTPSFAALRTLPDWEERFRAFFALNPHPAFTQVDGVTEPFPPERPSPIHPLALTPDEIDAITGFAGTIAPKDLGAPVR
jgi:mono/diheme cytochrome c family protein